MHFAPDTETTLEFTVALANTVAGATKSGVDEISTPAELTAFRASEEARLLPLIKAAGIVPQ